MNTMKWMNYVASVLLMGVIILCLPITAGANSSWVWISETRPYDVLPFVIGGTLAVETLSVWLIPRTKNPLKVFCVVFAGNVISFAMPYIMCLFHPVYTFSAALDSHFYTVGGTFLVMTVVVEGPIVYHGLKKETKHPKRLLSAIIGSNVLTTAAVAIVERTFCNGYWA